MNSTNSGNDTMVNCSCCPIVSNVTVCSPSSGMTPTIYYIVFGSGMGAIVVLLW